MSMKDEDNKQATITELVDTSTSKDNKGQRFFKNTDDVGREHVREIAKSNAGSRVVSVKDLLREKNMLVPGSNLEASFVDEYRRIKRPLLSNAFGKTAATVENGNLILVTSSIPGEGKTHTSINLALSMAKERDHTVLLVDCDVARHGSSLMLGVSDRPGLVDILENEDFNIGDAILRTDISELCVLAAGEQSRDDVTELLSSHRMARLVAEIGSRYDDRIIIFDAPPLLATPQTQVLTGLVGQVVFVVEAAKTPQALVNEALNMIPEDQAVGLVMNKSEGISSRSDYHYGYYGSGNE